MTSSSFTIDESFAGMPGIVHGGYLAGVIARPLGGPAEVTFRAPARTRTSLDVEPSSDHVVLRAGDTVVADARPSAVGVDAVAPVDLATARVASERCPGHREHPFASCFCCGPARGDDGLRIFPGPVDGREAMAAPWTPSARFATPAGIIADEIVWSALDCPGIYALCLRIAPGDPVKVVSGRLAVEIRSPVRAGAPHVVVAWPLGREGRKLFSAAALYTPEGEVVAIARQTCIVTDQGVPIGIWGLAGA